MDRRAALAMTHLYRRQREGNVTIHNTPSFNWKSRLTWPWHSAWPGPSRHACSSRTACRAAAQWLLQHTGSRALRLRSDVERKRLHGLAPLQASDLAQRNTFYGPQASEQTYASLRERAAELLRAGWTVLVDAAFLRRHERDAFAELARTLGCPFGILAPQAPVEVLRQRIAQRQALGGDPSEATLAVLERQLQWIEPLGDDEPRDETRLTLQ